MVKRLLLLNGVAIVCVILFHATGYGYTAMFSWAHRYQAVSGPSYGAAGSAAYYGLRLVEQLVCVAIPAFLFVSGFFVSVLAGRSGSLGPRAIGARVRALVVPYLVWTAVVLLALAMEGRVYSPVQYVRHVLTGSSNPNYYYVPMLVQLYLVAPVVVILARRRPAMLLALTLLVQLAVYSLQYVAVVGTSHAGLAAAAAWLPKWLFLAHLFWFSAGVLCGFHQQRLLPLIQAWRRSLLAAAIVLFVLGVTEWEALLAWSGAPWRENRVTLIDGLYAAAAIGAFLGFADRPLPFAGVLTELGGRSFGIYLAHGVVMEYFSRGLYHLAPWVLGQQWLFQPMLIVLGLSVPLLLMTIVRRSPTRGVYGYVFG